MNNFSLTCNRCGCTEITEKYDISLSPIIRGIVTYTCTECGMEEDVEGD